LLAAFHNFIRNEGFFDNVLAAVQAIEYAATLDNHQNISQLLKSSIHAIAHTHAHAQPHISCLFNIFLIHSSLSMASTVFCLPYV
jgi:hypothetical protein